MKMFLKSKRDCLSKVINRCEELLIEIQVNPTELCIRDLLIIVRNFEDKTKTELSKLYESSTPQISLRMPVVSFIPDEENLIDAQILIENRRGCSPAESVELIVVSQDDEMFKIDHNIAMVLPSWLRGNGQQYFRLSVRVSEKAIKSQAFSLPVYVQYETRLGDRNLTW